MDTVHKMEADANSAFDFLIRLGYQNRNIIVVGRSIGTGVAFSLAVNRNPGALVSVSSFMSIDYEIKKLTGGMVEGWTGFFNSYKRAEKVHMPTLLLHGKQDQIFSYKEARNLYRKLRLNLRDKVSFLLLDGINHDNIWTRSQNDYVKEIVDFVHKWLPVGNDTIGPKATMVP